MGVENQSKQDSVKSQPKQSSSQKQPSNQDLISLESTTEDGDGWDDDDGDWGSLEDSNSSKQNKTNEITKEEFDSWATDLLSNKVPDKLAVVKQGVQTLNLDDNDWGDTDWGDNSLVSKSNDAEEEKKGPMKL